MELTEIEYTIDGHRAKLIFLPNGNVNLIEHDVFTDRWLAPTLLLVSA